MSTSEVWHYCTKDQTKADGFKLLNTVAANKNLLHRKNCVIRTILPIWPEFVLSATILISLKPSLVNNTVRFSILFYFACQALLMPYNLDVNLWFYLKLSGNGKNLRTNIVTLVNLELNYGLMLEIKIIPNDLLGHMVSAVRFKMGHLLE